MWKISISESFIHAVLDLPDIIRDQIAGFIFDDFNIENPADIVGSKSIQGSNNKSKAYKVLFAEYYILVFAQESSKTLTFDQIFHRRDVTAVNHLSS